MPPPQIPRLQDSPRFGNGLQGLQRIEQDRPLLLHLEGFAEGMAEGVVKVQGSWRFHLLRHLFLERDPDSWNAFCLDGALKQAHGLIAEPSGRGEDDRVRTIAREKVGHLRRRLLYQGVHVRAVDVPHETIDEGSDPSDKPLGLELLEPV